MRERLDPWALVYNLYKEHYTREQIANVRGTKVDAIWYENTK